MNDKIKFVGTIKGTPLIKFHEERIIDLIQQGSFRMNSLKVYRDMYADSGDEIIGDPHEGRLYFHESTIFIPAKGVCEEIRDEAIPTTSENDFVFCMFGIHDIAQGLFKFNDEQKSKLAATYNTALIITDEQEFMRRIYMQASSSGIDVRHGFVRYYDETIDEVSRLCSLLKDGMDSIAFHKRKKYSYQQEYRFAVTNRDVNKQYLEMNIGDISDISVKMPSTDALNAIVSQKVER